MEVQTHKHLGVIISDKCDWQAHLEYIQAKAWSRVHLLRSLKVVLDRKSLQTMYFSFIRPILEYADVVWDNCTQQQMNDLEKIQIEAGQIVSGATKLVALDRLYQELRWLKFSERRKLHRLFLFYKMENGLGPDYLAELIPPRVRDEFLTVYVMPTIYGKSMPRLDHITTHFSNKRFKSGTNSQMMLSQHHLCYLSSIN